MQTSPNQSFVDQVQELGFEIWRRLVKVIDIKQMTNERWIRMAVIVCTYLLIRPWLVKLGAKITEKEYDNMEARDKERMAKQKEEMEVAEAVQALRGGKPATNETGTTTATEEEEEGTASLMERARHRAKATAEARKMVDDDKRANQLENWDEDDEFLRNFAKASDRAHATR